MYTKRAVMRASKILGTAVLAGALSAQNAAAGDHVVTVSVAVSSQGLDLTKPRDAQKFYVRLEDAAWWVCRRGPRVDLASPDNPNGCYENALADAVRSAKAPLVTQLYLATHTPQEAAAHAIEVPAQVAAK